MPAIPKTAVKMSSEKMLAKEAMGAAQPRIRAAAAGEGHVASVTKAGEVLLMKPQQANCVIWIYHVSGLFPLFSSR